MSVTDFFCLKPQYSTTRMVTKEQPRIENDPSSKVHAKLFLPSCPQRQGEGGLRTKGYFKKSFNDKPLVSVITVVFNGQEHLEQTIKSVISQTYDNVEYIIIDGGSTDGALDMIREYEHAIDYWVSEPDEGIYDAMNKGIDLAAGEWINFMNAGDEFVDKNVIQDNLLLLNSNGTEFIYSDTIFTNAKRKKQRLWRCDHETKRLIHQSCIYKKELHGIFGKYLTHKNITTADYIFFNLLPDKIFLKTNKPIALYNIDGISSRKKAFYQKIAVDFIFGNISRPFLIAINLFYPLYKSIKRILQKD